MSTKLLIHIRQSPEDLAQFTCERLAEVLSNSIDERGSGSFVLSGGQTPRRVYQLLASAPFSRRVDWKKVRLFFGDERMVPPDHADSNYGMAYKELISHVPVSEENIFRISGELPPATAAEKYAGALERIFKDEHPRFDCVLLGIGEDGHTASLFPGTDGVNEREKLAVEVFVPRLKAWRVTLTVPVINNARTIVFLGEGQKKSAIVRKVINATSPSAEVPATLIHAHDGELHWILDQEAASQLATSRP